MSQSVELIPISIFVLQIYYARVHPIWGIYGRGNTQRRVCVSRPSGCPDRFCREIDCVGLCVNFYFVLTLLLDLESYGYDSPIGIYPTRRLSGRHNAIYAAPGSPACPSHMFFLVNFSGCRSVDISFLSHICT